MVLRFALFNRHAAYKDPRNKCAFGMNSEEQSKLLEKIAHTVATSRTPPTKRTLQAMLQNIRVISEFLEFFQNFGKVEYIITRRINQDPL